MYRIRCHSALSWSRTVIRLRNFSRCVTKTPCNNQIPGCYKKDLLGGNGDLCCVPKNINIPSRHYCCQITEAEYEEMADETLDSLTEMFEDLPEKFDLDPDYDVTLNSGVLTVKISNKWGTYVINKQTPNKQIWFSSPVSGPKRYDIENGVWIYKHDNGILHQHLNTEISQAIGHNVDFTQCAFGKTG
ncbi:hypothetical protein ACF0H5_013319 [Mactra antiquata]